MSDIEYEKYYNDAGKVAVLYSPGYGAGWYTWDQKHEGLIFDKDIVQSVLNNDNKKAAIIARDKYDVYVGGASNLKIEWLEPGIQFEIDEYDGAETIKYASEQKWITA